MKRSNPLLLAVRLAFVIALLAGIYVALSKPNDAGGLLPWDKAQHFLAFFGFAGVAAAAMPRRPLWVPALVVIGYGALIEILQAIPMFHRDAEWADLFTDAFGVFCCYLPLMALAPWRKAMAR